MTNEFQNPRGPQGDQAGREILCGGGGRWGRKVGMRGMTLIEVFAMIVIVAILFAVFVPQMARGKKTGHPYQCDNNLKQTWGGLLMWSYDNGDRLPWQVSTNAVGTNSPGTLELITVMSAEVHFQAASNEIGSPVVLTCPRDWQRQAIANWIQLSRTNISYFINLDAQAGNPNTILLGDRNLTLNNKTTAPGLAIVTTNDTLAWDKKLHNQCGNVALAGGSVQQLSNSNFNSFFQSNDVATNRFVIP